MQRTDTAIAQWNGLIDATVLALAELRCDELERLASRAERMRDEQQFYLTSFLAGTPELGLLAVRRRMLGELLGATGRNLALLRQLLGRGGDGRWQR